MKLVKKIIIKLKALDWELNPFLNLRYPTESLYSSHLFLVFPFKSSPTKAEACCSFSCSSPSWLPGCQNLTHLSKLRSGNWNTQPSNLLWPYHFYYSKHSHFLMKALVFIFLYFNLYVNWNSLKNPQALSNNIFLLAWYLSPDANLPTFPCIYLMLQIQQAYYRFKNARLYWMHPY